MTLGGAERTAKIQTGRQWNKSGHDGEGRRMASGGGGRGAVPAGYSAAGSGSLRRTM